jgi:hypothetical protein
MDIRHRVTLTMQSIVESRLRSPRYPPQQPITDTAMHSGHVIDASSRFISSTQNVHNY